MVNTERTALLIGNSDGIGLAMTRELLSRGWRVVGLSRSRSPVDDSGYRHMVADVLAPDFRERLREAVARSTAPELCVYAAGIGELFDPAALGAEGDTIRVNLAGLADTVEVVLPEMISRGSGRLVGLSSMADALPSSVAPAYGASKAGMTAYLEGLAASSAIGGVSVTNVRLGFVDTKMAKSPVRPFMISAEVATRRILDAVLAPRPPARVNIPRRMAASMHLRALWPRPL